MSINKTKLDDWLVGNVFFRISFHATTVLVLSKLKKINPAATQPQHTFLKYFAILKNVAHCLEPGETPSYSASHQAPNYVHRS